MEKLPPELVVDIFARFLDHKDIKTIRLVSKDFNHHSLHLLIPRIVIAKRPSSIDRLSNVVHHPDLNKCVTELIWDVSAYNVKAMSDFENYIWACEGTEREFRDMETVAEDSAHAESCRMVGVDCAPLPWNLSLSEMEDYDTDTMYATGMHAGYTKYFRAWKQQSRIYNDGLHFAMLRLALRSLPKLRTVVFTDFRELTRAQEGYDELCHRLFGNSLEPDGLHDLPSTTDREFLRFQQIVQETRSYTTLDISVRVHQCGTSRQQLPGSLGHCCQPQTVRVTDKM